MDIPVTLGRKVIIRVHHLGCWASELSIYLHSKRPDLELVVYSQSVCDEPASYNAVAVIKSREKKEIGEVEVASIQAYLLSQSIIRSFKPRITRPSNYTLILLIKAFDDVAPASIRAVLAHGGIVHPRIGMPIINGVEHITFFAENPGVTSANIQSEYAQHSNTYAVEGIDIGVEVYDSEEKLFSDRYFLPTYIICTEDKRAGFLSAAKQSLDKTTEWIRNNAPWLIPLLAQILRWLASRRAEYGTFSPFIA